MAIPKVTEVVLEVPKLGKVTGLCFDGKTTQYYGVPYGTVPGRFRRPQPAIEPWPNGNWDGTKLGYAFDPTSLNSTADDYTAKSNVTPASKRLLSDPKPRKTMGEGSACSI